MTKAKARLLLVLLITSTLSYAQSNTSITVLLPHADHDQLNYLVTSNHRIYGGIVPDVFSAIFSDRKVEFLYMPLVRATKFFTDKQYDCIAPSIPLLRGEKGIYESKEFISSYQNRAIVLDSSPISISSVDDLLGRSVLAFPGASKFLGAEFSAFAQTNNGYFELNQVAVSIPMLFEGRVEVLILDENVFKFHAGALNYDFANGKNKVKFFGIFPATNYTIMCTIEELVREFDVGKQALKASGKLEEIINSNLKNKPQI